MKIFKKFAAAAMALCLCTGIIAMAACGEQTNTPETVTITYDTQVDGLTIAPTTSAAGKNVYPPADPERDGYRFEGWSLNGEPYVFTVMPDNDITLKAIWNKLYCLSFETGEGATQIQPLYYVENEQIVMPEQPERAHYKFTGWTFGGEAFNAETMPANDVTLTAQWIQGFTISFNTGVSGYNISPITEPAGTAISAPFVNRPGYFLRYWKLNGVPYDFTTMPDKDITLEAEWSEQLTSLPALFIDLSDNSGNKVNLADVTKDSYVNSVISLANTEDEYILNSLKSEFKGRGNGSWFECDKKGYKIKFDKKQSLFGRAANKHWVILACANFDDPTMSRNYIAYNMAGEVFSDIEYCTNAVWLDVYVNGEYRGVYILCEHVRVGTVRVDIESEYGVQDTGYLIEYDAYYAGEEGVDYFRVDGVNLKYAFTMHSPDPEDYLEEGISKAVYQKQVAYIKDYVTRVYKAIFSNDFATLSELADVDSFVDMYILHELFKNMDTGYSSFYLYKKPNGKLYAGPPWDFDATTSADDGNGRGDRSPQGLYVAAGNGSANTVCELYITLYQQTAFKNAVKARWKALSPQITAFLDDRLNDEVYETHSYAMGKNYVMWYGKTQAVAESDWIKDIKALKKWLTDRIAWLDAEWK